MTQNPHQTPMVILDFGSQYTQLIARRVRELGVYAVIHSCDLSREALKALKPKGIILSGGPETVTHGTTPRAPDVIFELNIPILGICYGMQTLVEQLGGKVESSRHCEFGYAQLTVKQPDILFAGITDHKQDNQTALLDVWMSHGDRVIALPDGFTAVASSDNAPFAAISNESKHYYGLQFHPEVTHTPQGMALLERFIHSICGCQALWTMDNVVQTAIDDIKKQVGSEKVLLALSGGVDSSVAAALLHKAIGNQLTCVFVDTGLLRQGEAQQVVETFGEHFNRGLIKVDAKQRFFDQLKGVTDPEEKRKRIGAEFINVFEDEANQLEGIQWLAQGTIYPDVIESGASSSGKAHVIKSHHNVGGLPERMKLKLIEPLRDCFKDEVRKMGVALGLPHELVNRHPFPGPGLALRVLGEIQESHLTLLKQADRIFLEELRRASLYDAVSQAFAVFLPVKSVGVMGDARQYGFVIALRAVETVDFMTARWAHLPHQFLDGVATRIMNEITGISRVVYDISGKPPATIEWE